MKVRNIIRWLMGISWKEINCDHKFGDPKDYHIIQGEILYTWKECSKCPRKEIVE